MFFLLPHFSNTKCKRSPSANNTEALAHLSVERAPTYLGGFYHEFAKRTKSSGSLGTIFRF